ncbi:MAG: hypothetical protein PHE43_01475 [Candidatus Nanoarchaeia archaeon]|nr:hypothetical protein [Candidatus Nanoarchaeia archaeon]
MYGQSFGHSIASKKGWNKSKLKEGAIKIAKKQAISYATGYIVNPVATDILVGKGVPRKKAKTIVDIASKFI